MNEIEILQEIKSHNYIFFESKLQENTNETEKNLILNYLKLYIFDELSDIMDSDSQSYEIAIFSLVNYFSNININKETCIWMNLCNILSQEQIDRLISYIIEYAADQNLEQNYNLYKIILSNFKIINDKYITKILVQLIDGIDKINIPEKPKNKPKSYDEYKKIQLTTWNKQITRLTKFILSIIMTDNIHFERFINIVTSNFNDHISKINLDIELDSKLDNYWSDVCLNNLIMILILIFDKINNADAKIDYGWITSDKCPITWYPKKKDDDNNYHPNNVTQLFFLILHGIRISLVPAFYRIIDWPEILNSIKRDLQSLDKNTYINFLRSILLFKQKRMTNILDDDKRVVYNFCYLKKIYKFYNYVIDTLTKDKFEADDIVDDMFFILNSTYLKYHKHINGLFDFSCSVTNYTKNNEILYKSINTLIILIHKKSGYSTEQNYEKFLSFIINYHNSDLNNLGIPKYLYRLTIYSEIMDCYDNNYDILLKLLCDTKTTTKFLNILLSDACSIINEIEDDVQELYKLQDKRDEEESDDECDEEYLDELDDEIQEQFDTLNSMITHLYQQTHFLNHFIDKFCTNIIILSVSKSDQILLSFTNFINGITYILKNFVGKKFELFDDFDDKKEINYAKKFLEGIILLICKGSICFNNENNDLIKNIKKDSRFDVDNYKFLLDDDNEMLSNIIKQLETNNASAEIEITDGADDTNNNLPDKFLDPLTFNVIKDPMLLPRNINDKDDIFIDKHTIYTHLFSKEENPFTREKLTIEQLEEYNNKPEIMEKINNFREELKKLII